MAEFLQNVQNAWHGWENYIERGKLAALLLASLLFLWYGRKRMEHVFLFVYTGAVAVCCICPVTAAVLMAYQTRFYDYIWIWSIVPATAMTAFGGVVFLAERWEGAKAAERRGAAAVTAVLLAAVLLSGGMGRQVWDREAQREERQRAYGALGQLAERVSEQDICLWAPREVMEYAREMDARIRLPYGRDMWDAALRGYSYDIYGEEMTALCRWMEQAEEGMEDSCAAAGHVRTALAAGVDCILLPAEAGAETLSEMELAFGTEAQLLEDYWIFYGRAD